MDFQGLTSPEQNADEGTLDQGPAQVDAEVGAGESDLADVPRAVRGAEGDWVTRGLVIVLALAIVSLGLRFIFLPSDRIPRIGSVTSRSDG